MGSGRQHTRDDFDPHLNRSVRVAKQAFPSRLAAEEWMAWRQHEWAPPGAFNDKLTPYLCRHCCQWHFGHPSKRQAEFPERANQRELHRFRTAIYWQVWRLAIAHAEGTPYTPDRTSSRPGWWDEYGIRHPLESVREEKRG